MKRLFLFAVFLVLFSTTLFSQDAPCPVAITDVRSVAGKMKVLFRNASQAEITRYEFVVWFVDFDQQTHFIPAANSESRKIKAGRSAMAVYPAPETLDYTFSEASAYVLHVTFADGNVWNDDGSHSCRMSALQE